MHFYPHNIGDFNNATRHLTRVERSVYRDAIERYYDTECALPGNDMDKLYRVLLCATEEEKAALDTVLSEFFTFRDGAYHHDRCDIEIEKYRSNTSAKARAGKASAAARANKNQHVLSACETDDQQNNNQEPITTNQEPKETITENPSESGKPDPCPHQAIVDLYHQTLPSLAKVRDITPARQTKLRARWRQDKRFQSLDWWRRYFEAVSQSDFLMGRAKDWQADFDFLITATKFQKIIEGGYQNGGGR